jgi:hypothetical protein
MGKLPKKIRDRLLKEAGEWDAVIASEDEAKMQVLLNDAEPFEVPRPPRQIVSLRMDALDISLLKRIARKKGIPYTQIMAMWLHEKIEHEKAKGGC